MIDPERQRIGAAPSVPPTPEPSEPEWHCEGEAVGIFDAGICSPERPIHTAPCGWLPDPALSGSEPVDPAQPDEVERLTERLAKAEHLLRLTWDRAEVDGWRPFWFANYVAPFLVAALPERTTDDR